MNATLFIDFTEEEVVTTPNQMQPRKALGPEGIPTLFFIKFWRLVKGDMIHLVFNVLNNGVSPKPLNYTNIVFIPKKKSPASPHDYRPISLCNIALKLVTKYIANRLKSLLKHIIHHAQSTSYMGDLSLTMPF